MDIRNSPLNFSYKFRKNEKKIVENFFRNDNIGEKMKFVQKCTKACAPNYSFGLRRSLTLLQTLDLKQTNRSTISNSNKSRFNPVLTPFSIPVNPVSLPVFRNRRFAPGSLSALNQQKTVNDFHLLLLTWEEFIYHLKYHSSPRENHHSIQFRPKIRPKQRKNWSSSRFVKGWT